MLRMTILGLGAFLILGTADLKAQVDFDGLVRAAQESRRDVRSDVRPDHRPDARPDVRPDRRPDVRPDRRPDVRPDARPDRRPDVRPDRRPDVRPDGGLMSGRIGDRTPGRLEIGYGARRSIAARMPRPRVGVSACAVCGPIRGSGPHSTCRHEKPAWSPKTRRGFSFQRSPRMGLRRTKPFLD